MRPPVVVDDQTFNDRVGRMVAVGGDMERAGLTLEEIADLVYTRRMIINPLGEATIAKAKTKATKIVGDKMDDLLG